MTYDSECRAIKYEKKAESDDCRGGERNEAPLLSSEAANMTEKSHRTGRTHHFLRDIILVSIIMAIIIKLMSLTSFAGVYTAIYGLTKLSLSRLYFYVVP